MNNETKTMDWKQYNRLAIFIDVANIIYSLKDLNMIDLMPAYDTAVLLSGDSDFAPLIKYVQKHNKKVIAISTRGHISKEIIQASDKFMWFNWFKDYWELSR